MSVFRPVYSAEATRRVVERKVNAGMGITAALLLLGVVIPALFCALLWVMVSDPALARALRWFAVIGVVAGGGIAIFVGRYVIWKIDVDTQTLLALDSMEKSVGVLGVPPDVAGEIKRRPPPQARVDEAVFGDLLHDLEERR